MTLKLVLHFIFHIDIAEIIIDAFTFQCMMIGGIGAILYKRQNTLFLKLADSKIGQGVAWLFVFFILINRYHIASVIDIEIISCVTVVIIVGQINVKNRIFNLEKKGFDFFGKISYGIYVYHPLLIFLMSKVLAPLVFPYWEKYLLVYFSVIGVTVLVAYLSYTYLESYFLRIKERFSFSHAPMQ